MYETCYNYNIVFANFDRSITTKFIKHFDTDASYYVWDWLDNV